MESVQILGLSVGDTHCLAWDYYGQLFAWGDNYWGKLGLPPINETYRYIEHFPKKVKSLDGVTII